MSDLIVHNLAALRSKKMCYSVMVDLFPKKGLAMLERLIIISRILLLSVPHFACLPQDSSQTYLAAAPNDCPPTDNATSVPSKTHAKTKAKSGAVKTKESKSDQEAVDKFAEVSTKLVGDQKDTNSGNSNCGKPTSGGSYKPVPVNNEQLKAKQLQAVEKFGQEAK